MSNDMDMDVAYAEGWRPEPGDVVIGVITDLSNGWSDQTQTNYPIVTLHDEKTDKDVAVHAFHQVLRSKLNELRPKVGETIGIKFVEKRPTKDGKREVSIYNVKVKGRSANIWDTPVMAPPPVPSVVTQSIDAVAPEDEGTGADDDIPF
jgi:hypothetical protein